MTAPSYQERKLLAAAMAKLFRCVERLPRQSKQSYEYTLARLIQRKYVEPVPPHYLTELWEKAALDFAAVAD